MFCSRCGKKITDDSRYCQFCGHKVINEQSTECEETNQIDYQRQINLDKDTELDRNALLLYLEDLLNLEVTLEELEEKKKIITQKNNELMESLGYRAFKIYDDRNYYIHFWVDEGKIYILTYNVGGYEMIFVEPLDHRVLFGNDKRWGTNFDKNNGYKPYLLWREVTSMHRRLEKKPVLSVNKWSRIYTDGERVGYAFEYSGLWEAYNYHDAVAAFKKYYELMKANGIEYYDNDCKECSLMKVDVDYIDRQLIEGKRILDNLYGLNIIPRIFRNVYSIYFINDYIRTSTESIQSAFLHLDLDTIKKQLGEVISQQREIICNQAIIQAQNEEIIKKNTEMLNRLAMVNDSIQRTNQNMNQNFRELNQYAKISAENLNMCKWLVGLSAYNRLF